MAPDTTQMGGAKSLWNWLRGAAPDERLDRLRTPALPDVQRPASRQTSHATHSAEGVADALLAKGAPASDRKRTIDLTILLAGTASGTDDMMLVLDNDVRLAFDTRAGGAGFQRARKTITLNRTHTVARTATDFAHEATHARHAIERRGADRENDTREQYVENMIEEETASYLREAVVGRELLHATRHTNAVHWRQVLTGHCLQMWFQLVHGAAYGRTPSDDILDEDRDFDVDDLVTLRDFVRPYFTQYVQFYRVVEGAKWDVLHRRRAHIDNEAFGDILAHCLDEQRREWTFPRRR